MDYTLYLCTDRNLMTTDTLEEAVEAALRGGVTVVQLREKDCSSGEFLEMALRIRAVTDRFHVPLIINDRADIALAAGAAGVHVGQSDLPPEAVRRILGPGGIVGVSAATVEEARRAEEAGADYLGVGAMFATGTKKNTRPVTMETLAAIRAAVRIPIVVIGGISEANAAAFRGTGVNGLAVISAILAQPDIEGAARRLRQVFTGGSGAAGPQTGAGAEKYPYAIFDMDGTLLDSMPFWRNVGTYYLRSRGVEPDGDPWEILSTMSTLEAAEYFQREYGLTESAPDIIRGFNDIMAEHYARDIPALPGVREYLTSLHEAGVDISLATATSLPLARAALERLGLLPLFSHLTSCDEVDAGKDRPDVFLLALEKLGAKPEETVLYDDAYFSVRTAKALGMHVVGVCDPTCTAPPEEMARVCDRYIRSFAGLTDCPQDVQ